MFRSRTLERGKAMVAATASAWQCPCWDCRAQRRQLLKIAVLVTLVLVAGGGTAYELGRLHLSASRPGAMRIVAAVVESAPGPATGTRGG
jgi:hypothetical protein